MTAAVRLTPDAADRVDGRHARSQRTRAAVIDALLALLEAGQPSPTTQQIATRAGISLRTVYQQFSDLEGLYAAAGECVLGRLEALRAPVPVELAFEQRLECFCATRARVLEALLPVMRGSRIREHVSAQLVVIRRHFVAIGDGEVRQAFAPELALLPREEREHVVAELHVAAGAASWETRRGDRGQDVTGAEQAMRMTVCALLSRPRGAA